MVEFGGRLAAPGTRIWLVSDGGCSVLFELCMTPLATSAAESPLAAAEFPLLDGCFCVSPPPDVDRLGTFVGDDHNPLVRWVVQVIEQPAEHDFFALLWPLTMVGPTGVGKSILASAVVARLLPRGVPAAVHTTADDLARSLQSALELNTLPDWRLRLDTAAVLLVENLPRLASLPLLQHQLADVLDARAGRCLPTLLISTEPLSRCGLSDRLVSRLQVGFTLPVGPPGPAALRCLIRQTFEAAGLSIAPQQIERLLAAGLRDASMIKSLTLRWLLERGRAPFDLDSAPASIFECLGATEPRSVQPDLVLKLTAKLFQLSVKDLRGSARTSNCCRARALAMWVCRQYLKISYQQIGSLFGNRDHSTVLSSCKKMEALLPNDVFLQATLQQLLSRLPSQQDLMRS